MRPSHRRIGALVAGVLLLSFVPACGGDEGDGEGGSSNPLANAVAKTEAAKTARMAFDMSVTGGGESLEATGEIVVDFEHDRNHLTMDLAGQTIELFADGPDEYVRQGSTGRYRPLPASAQTPVANNPSESLKYLGTDVIDVREASETGCYEGTLDFDRILERVERGREGEIPQGARGLEAPVLVCVDRQGRIRRYDVELETQGATVDLRSTITDHGEAPSLQPLGPKERPGDP